LKVFERPPSRCLEVPCTLRFMGSNKELKKVKTYFKTALFLSKDVKTRVVQPSTSEEVNELLFTTCDANQESLYSDAETTPCDEDQSSVFLFQNQKAKALLLNNNEEVE